MQVTVIDAGFGNLFSLTQALIREGAEPVISARAEDILAAQRLILPGVGAFGDACVELDRRGLRSPITEYAATGRPFLGICLGMQLLFESSEESPGAVGLGVLPGRVRRFSGVDAHGIRLKVPHMGWNEVTWHRHGGLASTLDASGYFYFVHSYYCVPDRPEDVLGACTYGEKFCAAVHHGSLHGVQFHPEKSQRDGAQVLRGWLSLA